ncbi:MAG: hypothetical protein JSR82_03040 [Verrucomicrobia bacterium]|nr:hypothetical protein [Verrucomicrobiota bacterium]
MNSDILGKTLESPDQFNKSRGGHALVFVDETFPLESLDAETAAHEIGHLLGLRHVNPGTALDPTNDEVMDDDVGTGEPRFINAATTITDLSNLLDADHNPVYHLLRYVDGWTAQALSDSGIVAGSWDKGARRLIRFGFNDTERRLYNAHLLACGETPSSATTLISWPSITLGEIAATNIAIPGATGVILVAQSQDNGQFDVITASGTPFNPSERPIVPGATKVPFYLYQQTGGGNSMPIASGGASVDSSLVCTLQLDESTIRIEFSDTLQSSTDLITWTDAATESPAFFNVQQGQSRFFRAARK